MWRRSNLAIILGDYVLNRHDHVNVYSKCSRCSFITLHCSHEPFMKTKKTTNGCVVLSISLQKINLNDSQLAKLKKSIPLMLLHF